MTKKRGAQGSERRPTDRDRQEAARAATLRVIERYGPQVMRTARRYAATCEDAEDAYQRAVEIMLTKAPEIPDGELLPWLKTVVKHEAFALRRKHQRMALGGHGGADADGEAELMSLAPTPAEQAERIERLRLGAEALSGLKPQEAQALALLAQGYSYQQICEATGWTYTKVNRCLAEGRRSFVQRVTRIESGAECERWEATLSAFVDGEAKVSEVASLRNHLRGCLACQSSLREYRLAPTAVAALLPMPLLERLSWPLERLTEFVTAVKCKVEASMRCASIDVTPAPAQIALSGSTRGIASTGLAKGLAVMCVGGAGVGGVAAVENVLNGGRPPSAKATEGRTPAPVETAPKSPDARLVAERLRGPDSRPRSLRRRSPGPPPSDFSTSSVSTGGTKRHGAADGGSPPRPRAEPSESISSNGPASPGRDIEGGGPSDQPTGEGTCPLGDESRSRDVSTAASSEKTYREGGGGVSSRQADETSHDFDRLASRDHEYGATRGGQSPKDDVYAPADGGQSPGDDVYAPADGGQRAEDDAYTPAGCP